MSAASDSDNLDSGGDICRRCGACCAFSREWPRFSLETEAELAAIPEAFVAENLGGMRCDGERCLALAGTIGQDTGCTIYTVRPQVCRSCMPGDDACVMARKHFRLYEMPHHFTAHLSPQERLQETSNERL